MQYWVCTDTANSIKIHRADCKHVKQKNIENKNPKNGKWYRFETYLEAQQTWPLARNCQTCLPYGQDASTGHPDTPTQLTHLDESGNIHMVDVTDRPETVREAVAHGRVRMSPHTVHLIETNQVSKGSVLEVAKIAGIMAAKQTPQIIPLCHPLPMTHIDLRFTLDSEEGLITIEGRTRTNYKTGVDVEALTAVTVAALTIYDMCKGVDTTITLEQAYVAQKSGGKSGTVNFQPS